MSNELDAQPVVLEKDATSSTPADEPTRATGLRAGFRRFRKTRPFWGAVILAVGAYFIARPVMTTSMDFYTSMGVRAFTPLLIGGPMLAAAITALVLPAQRHFPAIISAMLAVASLPLANLGGLVIGMLCGIIGAGLVFAWAPYSDKQLEKFAARDEKKAAKKAAKAASRQTPALPAA